MFKQNAEIAVGTEVGVKSALCLRLQAAAVLPCNAWEVVPSVQCHEDGPLSTGPSLGVRKTQRQRPCPRRVRYLQRRAGTVALSSCKQTESKSDMTLSLISLYSVMNKVLSTDYMFTHTATGLDVGVSRYFVKEYMQISFLSYNRDTRLN